MALWRSRREQWNEKFGDDPAFSRERLALSFAVQDFLQTLAAGEPSPAVAWESSRGVFAGPGLNAEFEALSCELEAIEITGSAPEPLASVTAKRL